MRPRPSRGEQGDASKGDTRAEMRRLSAPTVARPAGTGASSFRARAGSTRRARGRAAGRCSTSRCATAAATPPSCRSSRRRPPAPTPPRALAKHRPCRPQGGKGARTRANTPEIADKGAPPSLPTPTPPKPKAVRGSNPPAPHRAGRCAFFLLWGGGAAGGWGGPGPIPARRHCRAVRRRRPGR